MSPTKKFFSGNTVEQAVLQAARFFQIDPEQVAYEQVERRHGFLKVRRRVVIGVDPDSPMAAAAKPREEAPRTVEAQEVEPQPEPQPEASAVEPAPPAPEAPDANRENDGEDVVAPAAPVAPSPQSAERREPRAPRTDVWKELRTQDGIEAAEEALRRLFRMGNLDLSADVTAGEEGLEIEVAGPDENQLFEDRGRLLLAIEHLVSRMVRGLTGASVPCKVDSDNFHEVRAEQLRMLAQDAAAEVRREGRMQTLEPMSPDERRIVHITLAEDPAVETESHGTGLFKRVAVRPLRSARGGRDRYSR